jgi:hypothetical protein
MSAETQLDLFSLPVASPARASAPPADARASAIPKLRCGERWRESFASFDRATSSWRTSQISLLSNEANCSARWSGRWPRAGSIASGTAYRLPPSALRMDAIGSSSPLLPTPSGTMAKRPGPDPSRSSRTGTGDDLATAASRLLPTPASWDGRRGADLARAGRARSGADDLLTDMVKLLPTPNASLANYSEEPEAWARRSKHNQEHRNGVGESSLPLPVALKRTGAPTAPPSSDGRPSSAGLRLSPLFVEWMMGAPAGWSDPGCRLSATEFSFRPPGSWDDD